jgi:diacylglycerol kinase (ATP)
VRVAIILNGISLKKKSFYHSFLPAFKEIFSVDVFETFSKNHAFDLAAKAVFNKYEVIIAAGGDGTVHEVVNGMLQEFSDKEFPVFSVLPLGSGNDFARSIGASLDPLSLARAIKNFQTLDADIGEIICSKEPGAGEKQSRYFINVSDVGMGPEVVNRVLQSDKRFGSAVAYYKAILLTFLSYKPPLLFAESEKWEWKGKMRTFAVANGKYFGSGLCIAPDAKLDDNIFNVFACGSVSILDFLLKSIPLKNGKRVDHTMINYMTCTNVKLSSEEPLAIEADGEVCGWLPASIRISPVKLKVLKTG